MRINLSIFHHCKCMNQTAKPEVVAPISFTSFNLCEEYANAFRTESYNEFWARVLELTFVKGSIPKSTTSSAKEHSTAARLPSYRLFVESLLDPDQATVARVLDHARSKHDAENHVLLTDYFTETSNASLLCGLLLKDIEQVRLRCRPLKTALNSAAGESLCPQAIVEHLAELSNSLNPFSSLASSQQEFRAVQSGSSALLRRLESGRKKARARLRLANRLKRALAIFLVALTASTSVVGLYVALHTLLALVALPALLPRTFRVFSTRWLGRAVAKLDAAAKGAYILNRDLDTISRLVARLHDEVDHMLAMLRFFSERRGGERLRPTQEVVRQLKKNDACFNQQLDELEEHLFLCFMTVNKARSLVVKEVLVS